MTSTHDIRAAFIDLRDNYRRSGWVDSGMEQSIKQMGEALGVCEGHHDGIEASVRRIVSECIWCNPYDDILERTGREKWIRQEDNAVERLMRLIRHREGR